MASNSLEAENQRRRRIIRAMADSIRSGENPGAKSSVVAKKLKLRPIDVIVVVPEIADQHNLNGPLDWVLLDEQLHSETHA